MNDNLKWVVGALGVALAVILWFAWSHARPSADGSQEGPPSQAEAAKAGKRRVERRKQVPAVSKAQKDPSETKEDAGSSNEEKGGEALEEPKTEEEKQADREEALVNAFDDMTDKWREPSESDVPMAEVENFRQQFNKIPKARQGECLQRALNLLPDENVMLLTGILFDKEQPEEYLELVFNDILNKKEEVKKPILQEIYRDKDHPCWKEAAWILDATGQMPGK